MNTERKTFNTNIIEWDGDKNMSLAEFMSIVNQATGNMSQETFATAIVEFEDGYGEGSGSFYITYKRPETDEEYNKRVLAELDYKRKVEVHRKFLQERFDRQASERIETEERAELARLIGKWGAM